MTKDGDVIPRVPNPTENGITRFCDRRNLVHCGMTWLISSLPYAKKVIDELDEHWKDSLEKMISMRSLDKMRSRNNKYVDRTLEIIINYTLKYLYFQSIPGASTPGHLQQKKNHCQKYSCHVTSSSSSSGISFKKKITSLIHIERKY